MRHRLPWLVAAALVAGCGSVPEREARLLFGPPAAPGTGPVPAAAQHGADPTAPAAKFTISARRIDAATPGLQGFEPSIAVARSGAAGSAGDEVWVAWMQGTNNAQGLTTASLGSARSADGGRSWSTSTMPVPAGPANIPADPVLVAERASGTVIRAALARAATTPDRIMWVDARPGAGGDFRGPVINDQGARLDKPWLAVGARAAGAPGTILYAMNDRGVQRSLDGGASFSALVPIPGGGRFPQAEVLPDGRLALLAVLLDNAGQQPAVLRFSVSSDEAATFRPDVVVHRSAASFQQFLGAVPGDFVVAPFTTLARSPVDGTLYAAAHDVTALSGTEADMDVLVFRSTDDGATWSAAINATRDAPPLSDQFMPSLRVDRLGRVHLAFLDSRRTAGGDAAPAALVDAWYARSDDRGLTWVSQRLTQDALDSSRTNFSPIAPARVQFVGDYLGLDVSDHAAYVAHPAAVDGAVAMVVSRIEFQATSDTVRDPRGFAGAWFDPATSGQGLSMLWIPGGVLTVSFFGYRNDGSNLWLLGVRQGPIRFGETMVIPLDLNRGGRFGNFAPAQVERVAWGSLTLRFDSCSSGQAILDGLDGRQTMALTKLVGIDGLGCD